VKEQNQHPGSHDPRQIRSLSSPKYSDSQSTCNSDHISRVVGRSVKVSHLLSFPAVAEVLLVTNLIVKEAVLDIFRDSRCSLNIIFTYLIARSIDTIVEHVSIVPYWSQSAREN